MEAYLREIVQLSLSGAPEEMLKRTLDIAVEVSGASGGSILGEEGPYLQFLFSNVPELIGVRVPFRSIAGDTVNRGVVVYTFAPTDKRHFDGVDQKINRATRYLLSIPIPSIHRSAGGGHASRNAGVLQLLFDTNILPDLSVESGPREFPVEAFRDSAFYAGALKNVFWLLPNVAFGMEVMKLRQTSYQVIHELKNKLISGLSWLDCLKEDLQSRQPGLAEAEDIRNDFELSESAMREGSELAKTYLQLTKIYNPQFAPVNINDVLKETALSARALAPGMKAGAEVEVVFRPDPRIEPRSLDASQLKMAFFNLCKNAVEALVKAEAPGARLEIATVREDPAITVTIADNGPGMPPEIADNLFVPFKTKKEGGTGLGLTITKKIVDIHGGTIACATGSGGTTFTVRL